MSQRNLIWIGVIVVLCVMLYRLPRMSTEQDTVQRSYAPLAEVDALVRRYYVEPLTDDRLVEGAVRGMMRQLDPYSGYIGPAEMEAFRRSTSGKYIGIGVEGGMQRGQLTVIAPIDDGPAIRAGIRAGDVILEVDGLPTDDLTVSDLSELLRGPAGTTVILTVCHRGNEEPETIPVVRGAVNVCSVKGYRHLGPGRWSYLIDPDALIGYVRVSSFQEDTAEDFDRSIDELRGLGAKALILDLRYNPGGLVSEAIKLADRFVSEGLIVSTVTRRRAVREHLAHREGVYPPIKLVVLVNGATASAAEIVSGALQAHERATVVGSRSFGKGVVQELIELHDRSAAIRLTVSHFRLPNGRIIHKTLANATTDQWGIIPDVEVVLSDQESEAVQEGRRAVDAAVDYATTTRGVSTVPTTAPAEDRSAPAVQLDRQLAKALEIAGGVFDPASSERTGARQRDASGIASD